MADQEKLVGSKLRNEMQELVRRHSAKVVVVLLQEEILIQVHPDSETPATEIVCLIAELESVSASEVDDDGSVGSP